MKETRKLPGLELGASTAVKRDACFELSLSIDGIRKGYLFCKK